MQKIQIASNDLAWQTIQAKDIKPGNLITALTAKTPRLISNVIIDNNVVTLYEKTGMHEHDDEQNDGEQS